MNIQTIVKKTLKKDIAKASKLVVRELEEETKGSFIAFVDEGEDSFDVRINCNEEEVVELYCDCNTKENTCLHKVAVLLQLVNKGETSTNTVAKTTGRKRKLSESEELLLRLDKEAISTWLAEVFKKNKPLEQQFLLTLGTNELNYTAEQVKEVMEQTIKSVAGRRKTLEGANVKKLMDLIAIAFQPINQFVTVNIHKPIAYEIYVVVIETMQEFQNRILTYSKKINSFYDDYMNWFAMTINTIQDEVLWKETVRSQINRAFNQKKEEYRTYNDDIVRLLYETSSINQRSFIVAEIAFYLCNPQLKRRDFDIDFILFLKEMALDEHIFDQVQLFFKIEKYNW